MNKFLCAIFGIGFVIGCSADPGFVPTPSSVDTATTTGVGGSGGSTDTDSGIAGTGGSAAVCSPNICNALNCQQAFDFDVVGCTCMCALNDAGDAAIIDVLVVDENKDVNAVDVKETACPCNHPHCH